MFGKKRPQQQPSKDLVHQLAVIGVLKRDLPFRSRGWVPFLGLYVQFRTAGGAGRLEAGGKYRADIDIRFKNAVGWAWEVDRVAKYTPGDWEQLVYPTLEVALWLHMHGGGITDSAMMDRLERAAHELRTTGRWALFSADERRLVREFVEERMSPVDIVSGSAELVMTPETQMGPYRLLSSADEAPVLAQKGPPHYVPAR